jgi:hypothetical protein
MKRVALALSLAIVLAGASLTFGQGGGHPFYDRTDTGETVHILPSPASIHSPRDTQPTFAPSAPGLAVYGANYGSGNLLNHGGHEIPGASFLAIYWNATVANASGSGVISPNYTSLRAQLGDFVAQLSDGYNYTQADTSADYTIIQQYGATNAISSSNLTATLSPTGLGYFVDSKATQASISDSNIRSYLTGLLQASKVPVSANIIYGMYFPPSMKITLQGGTSCSSFCGYHGHFTYNGRDIQYAVFPYTNCNACKLSTLSVADMLTIVTSHEIREAVTDPDLNAWYDRSGYEADDKCAWHNLYQTVHGGFWVQPEYSNGGTVTDVSGVTGVYPGPGCIVPK